MGSSIFSAFSSVSLLLLGFQIIGDEENRSQIARVEQARIANRQNNFSRVFSPNNFHIFSETGSKSGNMAMAFEEVDSMAILPFGSASGFGIGSFIRLPRCGGPRRTVNQDSPQDYVAAHNAARAQVGIRPVHWDGRVASFAQNYADQRINDCKLMNSGGPYGENLAWGSPDLSGTNAVRLWVDEKQFYNHTTNTCAAGKVCGHYTQVVWRNSLRIGCAKVECTDSRGTFIICNYDPPGWFDWKEKSLYYKHEEEE